MRFMMLALCVFLCACEGSCPDAIAACKSACDGKMQRYSPHDGCVCASDDGGPR